MIAICSSDGESWADLAADAGPEEDASIDAPVPAPVPAWDSGAADAAEGVNSVEGAWVTGSSSSSSSGSSRAALLPQWERYSAEGTPQGGVVRSDDGGVRGRRARRGGRTAGEAAGSLGRPQHSWFPDGVMLSRACVRA